jgi:hypothetical protein
MSNKSPLTFVPKTVGECLDHRKNTERRINNSLTNATNDSSLIFLKEGTHVLSSAESQVQSVLDRYQALCELNEIINAVSALKMTDVVMPSFCSAIAPVKFTLGCLRDSKTWVLPILKSLVSHISNQANTVKQESLVHNKKIETTLQRELDKNKQDFEERKKRAIEFNEVVPSDDELNAMQELARNRAKTQMAILVDPVGVKDLVSKMTSFTTMLETFADTKIDAVNSTSITEEVEKFRKIRDEAYEEITTGKKKELVEPDDDTYHYVSLAELKIMTNDIKQKIVDAIPFLQVVSYKKGQVKELEHSAVENAEKYLTDVLFNISTLLQYRRAFRDGMSLNFPTLHPLSGVPLSVDGLVRLGFLGEKQNVMSTGKKPPTRQQSRSRGNARGGRGRSCVQQQWIEPEIVADTLESTLDYYTLADCLDKLFGMLDSVESKLAVAKKEHEKILQESISAKQDARSKNAAALKPGELDEIAKSIRATESKVWSTSDNIDKAMNRVSRVLQQVEEMQSSVRKSANSTIKVLVPFQKEMFWAMRHNTIDAW